MPRTHPLLDQYLYQTNYAPTYNDAVTYCKQAAGYMTDICVNVPLWSTSSYWAWSRMLGIANAQVDGSENKFTFMNTYKGDGTPIRCGTVNYPFHLNIVYSSWVYDYNILDRKNLFGGVDYPPYNYNVDQVGFVDYFHTGSWMDGEEERTKVIMSFRENAYSCVPVSGDQGENINATHYFINAWLDYQVGDGWWSPQFRDLHHIEIIDEYSFAIYFDTYSYWNTYYCQGPLRPIDHWFSQGSNFISQAIEAIDNPTTPGAVDLTYKPIWIDSVTFNSVPLDPLLFDYNIVKGKLFIYRPLVGSGTLHVLYRYVPANALGGFFPGDLPWQNIAEGAGPYYMTSYTSGYNATFERNPFYYMVTPLLGDIDFVNKPSGNYKVDIYDLSLAGGAYGSQGKSVPSANWFPGADLAPEVGVIDIYDLVTVTGINWDKEYDPLNP